MCKMNIIFVLVILLCSINSQNLFADNSVNEPPIQEESIILDINERIDFEFDKKKYSHRAIEVLDDWSNDWKDDHDYINPYFASIRYNKDGIVGDAIIVLYKDLDEGWATVFFIKNPETKDFEVASKGFTLENDYEKIISKVRGTIYGFMHSDEEP